MAKTKKSTAAAGENKAANKSSDNNSRSAQNKNSLKTTNPAKTSNYAGAKSAGSQSTNTKAADSTLRTNKPSSNGSSSSGVGSANRSNTFSNLLSGAPASSSRNFSADLLKSAGTKGASALKAGSTLAYKTAIYGTVGTLAVSGVQTATLEHTTGGYQNAYVSEQAYYTAGTGTEVDSASGKTYTDYQGSLASVAKFISLYRTGITEGAGGQNSPYDLANRYYEAGKKAVANIEEVFFKKARTNGAKGGLIEQDLNEIIEREQYDYELTWESFDYTKDIFEGTNNGEFLSIMTEVREYDSMNATYQALERLASSPSKIRQLYRLHVETAYITKMEAGRATPEYDDNGHWTNEDECMEEIKYGIVTLQRYYLRDLFEFFNLKADAVNYRFEDCIDNLSTTKGTSNIEFLERIEETMRHYCNMTGSKGSDVDLLGPKDRSAFEGYVKDTPLKGNTSYHYNTSDTINTSTVIYQDNEGTAHGQIGAEYGDITGIAKAVGQAFLDINPINPYGNGQEVTGNYDYEVTVTTPWYTTDDQSPCCALGSTYILKYYGLKASPTHSTKTVMEESGIKQVSVSSVSDLRVGDVLTYKKPTGEWTHTEVVTKIDNNKVYIAGYGSDEYIKLDASQGWNREIPKSNPIETLESTNHVSVTVLRPDKSSFDFTD